MTCRTNIVDFKDIPCQEENGSWDIFYLDTEWEVLQKRYNSAIFMRYINGHQQTISATNLNRKQLLNINIGDIVRLVVRPNKYK